MRVVHSHLPPCYSHSSSQSDEGPSTENGRVRGKKAGKVRQNTPNRKNSASARGKSVSSLLEGGVICKSPFPVSPSLLVLAVLTIRPLASFYIAQSHTSIVILQTYRLRLPESERARQLLIWYYSRALGGLDSVPLLIGLFTFRQWRGLRFTPHTYCSRSLLVSSFILPFVS